MVTTNGASFVREWYIEKLDKSNSFYFFHLRNGLVFEDFESCEKVIEERIVDGNGTYKYFKPKRGARK